MRFQDGNSTIIGLNYISEPWNSLGVRRERERERDGRARGKQNARSGFPLQVFLSTLATCFVNSNGVLRSFVRGCTSAANAGKRSKRAVAPNFSYV